MLEDRRLVLIIEQMHVFVEDLVIAHDALSRRDASGFGGSLKTGVGPTIRLA